MRSPPEANRVPRASERVSNERRPRVAHTVEHDSAHPMWRLGAIDHDGPFGWGGITREKLLLVHGRLSNLETMTWHEILIASKKFNHAVTVSEMSKAAQDRLLEIKMDDVDELVSLRVTGKERVWVIRHGGLCNILWWDPLHEVCPSKKKHT